MQSKNLINRRRFFQTTGVISLAAIACAPMIHGAAIEDQPVFDINPSPDNPRNSEGAFLTLNSGRILFFYTRFYGGASDASPAQIVSISSDDAGATWTKDHKTVVENTGKANVMSVSVLRLHSGRIALFYLVKNSAIDCRPYAQFSDDEAETWTTPQRVGNAPGYFVLNNDRVVQLQSGRMVMPLAFHRSRGSDPKNQRSRDSRAIALWQLSDDEGATWREAEDWWALPIRSNSGFQEPGVVEISGDRLFSWMRTDQGAQFGCWSTDAGQTWPLPEKTDLVSPLSPASIKRLPGSGDLLALFNDHSGQFAFQKGKRTPLVAAISSDSGKTWPRRKVIEADPDGWYCYTAMHFVKGHLLLGYCAGDPKVGHLNRLRLRRIPLNWLQG